MIALALKYWWAFVIAGLLILVGVQELRVSAARNKTQESVAEFANYRAAQAETARLAERSRRDIEQRWTATVEGVSDEGQKRIDLAQAAAARAGAAEQRLQQRVSTFLAAIRGAAENSGIAATGTTTSDPSSLLADLFGRARERARILGGFADDAHTRGQVCQRYAEGLQPK